MASLPSCSLSDLGDHSPVPSQPSDPSVSQWTTSSGDPNPPEQPRAIRRPTAGKRSAAGRAPPQRRPAVASSSASTRESPEWTASMMSAQDIVDLGAKYGFPPNIRLSLPTPNDRVISSRPGRVALYKAFFKAGLRLPIHPFILNIMDRYSLTPSQLAPNSFRTIVGFMVLCHLQDIEASISLFRSFYTLRKQGGWWSFTPRPTRILKLYLPTSVKGWKNKFFFADVEGVRGDWGTPNTDANRDSSIIPRDRMAFGKLVTANIPRCSQLLSEGNLLLAGLIPSSGE